MAGKITTQFDDFPIGMPIKKKMGSPIAGHV
jgi:hypothetical protein